MEAVSCCIVFRICDDGNDDEREKKRGEWIGGDPTWNRRGKIQTSYARRRGPSLSVAVESISSKPGSSANGNGTKGVPTLGGASAKKPPRSQGSASSATAKREVKAKLKSSMKSSTNK